MQCPVTSAVTEAARTPSRVSSREAKRLFSDLMAVPPEIRRGGLRGLTPRDLVEVLTVAAKEGGTPYCLYQDDPSGFVEDVLQETTWSKQRDVLNAIPHNRRVAVPSAFGTGKTHIAARGVVWRGSVFPVGTSLTVTTATRFRQVRRQLWPHIRAIHKRAGLPGQVDQTQWAAPNNDGVMVDVAYGFSAPPHDESAVQGIHAPKLFIVIDEAGGIGRVIGGAMRGLLTGEETRLLAIGNPPTDDEGSWFEGLCLSDDVCTIPISAYDSPQLSGEAVLRCRSCPPEVPEHSLAAHLVDQEWVDETIAEHGDDAPYVTAKVHAKFPKGGPRRAIPSTWVDLGIEAPEPEDGDDDFDEYVRLCDLDLSTEQEEWHVKRGAWIRLGVDVAADGGDEFVVSRSVGNLCTIRHIASGAANANHLDVSGEVLREIKEAEALAAALGTTSRIHVKVDVIGLGWGVVGTLTAWGSEGLHTAKIVGVDVRESTHREPDAETLRPARKRDELWLAGRSLLTPTGPGEPGMLRLRIDRRTQAQLSAPMMGTNSGGLTVIEAKSSMRTRGLPSPDRAEALLLSLYEPIIKPKRKKARLIV
jgi:hypothetical protein